MQVSELINVSPPIAAEGYFFCLDTKEAKNQVSKEASLPHNAFTRPSSQNHGLQNLASTSFAHIPTLPASIAMPLPPHKAIIVLPAFIRSCFADRRTRKSKKNCCDEPNYTEQMRHRQKAASTGIAKAAA